MVVKVMNPFCRLYSSIYCVESVISTVGQFTTHTIEWQRQLIYFSSHKNNDCYRYHPLQYQQKKQLSLPLCFTTTSRHNKDEKTWRQRRLCFFCVCGCWNKEVSPYFVAVYKRWVTQEDLLQPETLLRWGELIVHWEIIAICRKLRSSGYEIISSQFSSVSSFIQDG